MMLIVLAMDAIQAIPFAYLRYKKRPIKFAGLKLLFMLIFMPIVLLASLLLRVVISFIGKTEKAGFHSEG